MNEKNTFCYCDSCNSPILHGDNIVIFTRSQDEIENNQHIKTIDSEVIGTFCIHCSKSLKVTFT